ncbi:hypothetical protein ACLB2K_025775 [Fragaria x ananassa]
MATYRALLSLKSSLDDPDSRLSALSALRLFNLSNNVFNRTFPPELSNLTNLRVLDLYNNNLTGVLPVSVATFHLSLSFCLIPCSTGSPESTSSASHLSLRRGKMTSRQSRSLKARRDDLVRSSPKEDYDRSAPSSCYNKYMALHLA